MLTLELVKAAADDKGSGFGGVDGFACRLAAIVREAHRCAPTFERCCYCSLHLCHRAGKLLRRGPDAGAILIGGNQVRAVVLQFHKGSGSQRCARSKKCIDALAWAVEVMTANRLLQLPVIEGAEIYKAEGIAENPRFFSKKRCHSPSGPFPCCSTHSSK